MWLFLQILADSVGIPCKLVKGSNYTGDEDDAVNIIKVDKEREFLVDLMAAPGALIPADVLSWKGSSSNSNHKLGQKPGLNQMAGSSSTIYPTLGANALPLEHKDVFDGSWTLVPHTQSDEPSTSAGTSSQHKVVPPGGEHPGAGNIKLSPGHQENTESSNLFAELNPFGRIEPKKASVPFNGPDNRNNELQRRRENVVPSTGRPQQRLVMKNWSPYNDVSNNKQYNYVQDSFARRNVGDNVVSSPQVPRSAANNINLNIGARNDGSPVSAHNNDSFMAGSSAMKMPSVADIGKAAEMAMRGDLSKGTTGSRLEDQPPFGRHKWGDSTERRVPTNSVQNQAKERETNFDGKQDHKKLPPDPKKSPLDRFMDVSMPSRNSESVSPSSARSHRLDCVFDDVSECEILWEDLVIGERIGLGSYGEVYRADWNGTGSSCEEILGSRFLWRCFG
uniref:EDR1/CTR1/ARMC3-like peptidase-like domain-containing protein n=1 Tax=Aegilops tauschii subsp. strangulata TaxID=200361 RepID=A0A453ITP0_AEGTS